MAKKHAKGYDVTLKDLVTLRPRDLLILAGITDAIDVQPEDTDLSALIAVADKVLRVRTARGEFLVHFEFQSGYDKDLVEHVFWYNAGLHHRHKLPVLSVVSLLTRKADHPRITGTYQVDTPSGRGCLTFRYAAIRFWQTPVTSILAVQPDCCRLQCCVRESGKSNRLSPRWIGASRRKRPRTRRKLSGRRRIS